ncbi:cation-transporting P-type ATPase, partial [Mycobacterium tuberculosis]|nr:cation-transporting P-type ATPase [Mycobacterium tuberculosis]
GERLPADALLVAGEALTVDESVLTGEAVPVTKLAVDIAAAAEMGLPDPGLDTGPGLYSGTLVTAGQGVALGAADEGLGVGDGRRRAGPQRQGIEAATQVDDRVGQRTGDGHDVGTALA